MMKKKELQINRVMCFLIPDLANGNMEEIEISTISGLKTNYSVIVRNAYKRYVSTSIVLNGLNLNVPEGTM